MMKRAIGMEAEPSVCNQKHSLVNRIFFLLLLPCIILLLLYSYTTCCWESTGMRLT